MHERLEAHPDALEVDPLYQDDYQPQPVDLGAWIELRARYGIRRDEKGWGDLIEAWHQLLLEADEEAYADAPNGPAPFSTLAPPGTAAKIAVMQSRVQLGFELAHPSDAQMDPFHRVRVPIHDPGNHKVIGWKIVPFAEYMRLCDKATALEETARTALQPRKSSQGGACSCRLRNSV